MKITIEPELAEETLPNGKMTFERVESFGLFGYHFGRQTLSQTVGDLAMLYDRSCGMTRSIDLVLQKFQETARRNRELMGVEDQHGRADD
jgi:hypothetical protein